MSQTDKQPFSERAMELAEQHKQKYPDYKYKPRRRPKESKKTHRRNKKLQQQHQQQEQQQQQQQHQGETSDYRLSAFNGRFSDSFETSSKDGSVLSAEGFDDDSLTLRRASIGNALADEAGAFEFLQDTAVAETNCAEKEGESPNEGKTFAASEIAMDRKIDSLAGAVTSNTSSPLSNGSSCSASPPTGSSGAGRYSKISLEAEAMASAPLLSDLLHTPPYSPDTTKANVLEFHHLKFQAGGYVRPANSMMSPAAATAVQLVSLCSPHKRKHNSTTISHGGRTTVSLPSEFNHQQGKRLKSNAKTSRNNKSTVNLSSFPNGEKEMSPFGGMPTPDGSPLERRKDVFFPICDGNIVRNSPARHRFSAGLSCALRPPTSFRSWNANDVVSCSDYGTVQNMPAGHGEVQSWEAVAIPASLSSTSPSSLASPCIKSLLQQPPTVLPKAHIQTALTFGDRQTSVVNVTNTVLSSYVAAPNGSRYTAGHAAVQQHFLSSIGQTSSPSYLPSSSDSVTSATGPDYSRRSCMPGVPRNWDNLVNGGVNAGSDVPSNAFADHDSPCARADARLCSRGSCGNGEVFPSHPQPYPHHQQEQRGGGNDEDMTSNLQRVLELDKLGDLDNSELDCYLTVNQTEHFASSYSSSSFSFAELTRPGHPHSSQKNLHAIGESRNGGDFYAFPELSYNTTGHDPQLAVSHCVSNRRLKYYPCEINVKLGYASHCNAGPKLSCSPSSAYSDSDIGFGEVPCSSVRASYSSSSSPESQQLPNSGESFFDLDKQMAVVNSYPRL